MLPHGIPRLAAVAGLASGLFVASNAAAIPIDLNDFYFDPFTPVTVASDGSTATLAESAEFGVVFLSNIPGLGDPEVITGGTGVSLAFDYVFDAPLGNEDVFHVALLDALTGDVLGGLFETFLSSTASGQQVFDLSSFAGTSLGLQFELAPGIADGALTSVLTISNLQLLLPSTPPTTVPEPSSLLLALFGFLLACCFRVNRYKVSPKTQT